MTEKDPWGGGRAFDIRTCNGGYINLNVLISKFREVLLAVTPIVILVVALSLTLAPVPAMMMIRFVIGAFAIVMGLSILLFGIEMGVQPFGNQIGGTLLKSNKLWVLIAVGFLLGFFVNIAEPDLHVLANQVSSVMGGYISLFSILVTVSVGTGLMLAIGLARIVKSIPLNIVFAVGYGIALLLAIFASSDMLAIGFDSSGATTGALTTPLVLALSFGVAAMKRDSKSSEEDSFGLVGVMSIGAILGVLTLNIFVKTDSVTGLLETHEAASGSILWPFIEEISKVAGESFIALLPVIVIFILFQKFSFHLHKKQYLKMLRGFLYTYIGLIIFLIGVNAGFMKVGNSIGHSLASHDSKAVFVGFGFLLGMLVILTEPAVYVLTQQIENVTSGYIKKKTVLASLSIGVAFAVGLSMLRIAVPGIQLWHYLLPCLLISVGLSFFVPKLFVGIAFDSGGVASGPMTATFVLAFAQGASDAIEYSNLLVDSFGVIAMVAMTPLIALQVLGLIYKLKARESEVS